MSEQDYVLELFDSLRKIMEGFVDETEKNEEAMFRKQSADVGKNLWWFMDEMLKAGFSNTQAFTLLRLMVIDPVMSKKS